MSRSQWLAILGALVLTIACFMPWMHIEDPSITISGVDTAGTRYGKPAYNHFIFMACIIACTFIAKIWAKRINLLFGAANLAWAIRNFAVIPSCDGGICPDKLLGIYLVLAASVILMATTLFPKEPIVKNNSDINKQNK